MPKNRPAEKSASTVSIGGGKKWGGGGIPSLDRREILGWSVGTIGDPILDMEQKKREETQTSSR